MCNSIPPSGSGALATENGLRLPCASTIWMYCPAILDMPSPTAGFILRITIVWLIRVFSITRMDTPVRLVLSGMAGE